VNSNKVEDPWDGPEILVPFNAKLLEEIRQVIPDIPVREAIPILTKIAFAPYAAAKVERGLGLTAKQRREMWSLMIVVVRGSMKYWRRLKSNRAKLKHGLFILQLITRDLETDKDVRSGRFLTPREYRRNLYAYQLEIEKAFKSPFQRQLKEKIMGLEAGRGR